MKLFEGYNDYELLYMIKENDEKALEIMILKYTNFIKMKLSSMRISYEDYDEYIQEGQMVLLEAIKTFNDAYQKTFLRYFELLLMRRLYRVNNSNRTYLNMIVKQEDFDLISAIPAKEDPAIYSQVVLQSDLERQVFNEIMVGKLSIKLFCQRYGLEAKKIYNIIYKIKKNNSNLKQKG